jgi:hypothetical protein
MRIDIYFSAGYNGLNLFRQERLMVNRKGESFVAGIVLLVLGIYLVMANLGMRLPPISYHWLLTIILITIGIMAAIKVKPVLKLIGLVALILGGIFLMDLMGILSWPAAWKLKDAVFIFLGLFLIY